MSNLSDISLVAQVVAFGNTRAYDKLVQKYQSPIRRFFLHQTCGDEQLSDDLAQDTFIKAYTSLSTFQNLANFSTWLFRIAYNVFYDYLRSRKDTTDLEALAERTTDGKQEELSVKDDIFLALQTLKEVERTCINLFYMEDVGIDKIANILSLPANTVKSHLARGKQKMAVFLKQNGYDKRNG